MMLEWCLNVELYCTLSVGKERNKQDKVQKDQPLEFLFMNLLPRAAGHFNENQ